MRVRRECSVCVMDTSADEISFDVNGVCNFCREFRVRYLALQRSGRSARINELSALIKSIREEGDHKPYDCVVGVSGGVDSSFVLCKAVEAGLRPLAVHLDNGWNSELSQENVSQLVRGLGVDLKTFVVDWQEYREILRSFLAADVVDLELPFDNAMLALNYGVASQLGLKYILSGSNQSTEGMSMPVGWNWNKFDARNVRKIAKSSGVTIETLPLISTLDFVRYSRVRGIKWVSFLDYFDYAKNEAEEELELRFGFKRYPHKHYESVLTRFYQAEILPRKFGIDKRRLHLSSLVVSGQMTRSRASEVLSTPPYLNPFDRKRDYWYFLKKLRITESEFEQYLGRPSRSHAVFGSERTLWRTLLRANDVAKTLRHGVFRIASHARSGFTKEEE